MEPTQPPVENISLNLPQGEQFPETPERKTKRLKSFVIIGATIVVLTVIAFMLTPIAGRILSEQGAKQITPTITQQVSPTSNPDPTEFWKTYEGSGFSFKYPDAYGIQKQTSNEVIWKSLGIGSMSTPDEMFLKSKDSPFKVPLAGENILINNRTFTIKNVSNMRNVNQLDSYIIDCQNQGCLFWVFYFDKEGKYYELIRSMSTDSVENINDQILSTFKFTDLSISPSNSPQDDGGACTLEAKECPDGSWVGRQGPNCEFAACP